ncbi:MAG: carbamate kinase [Gammaproteobacteria bacterium]|nr:carbamate kinase [Gammaproteobacteria bacterium]
MTAESHQGVAVLAVGGNSLIADSEHESIPDQSDAAEETAHHIAELVAQGWRMVVTHGSGPQIGFILRRSELSLAEVPPVPMDYAGADLQGAIGYMLQRALHNEFHQRRLDKRAIAVVTQTLVARDDPAMTHPNKPIGSYMDAETAELRKRQLGWTVMEDAGRGWRRVVPSPEPRSIVDLAAIRDLLAAGYTVIACGGGGIPVIEDEHGQLIGIEAVIDKDYASGLLAAELGADRFIVSTAVEQVAIGFNTPAQQWLDQVSLSEAHRHDADGQFAEGSMAPKVRAIMRFVERTGHSGLITNPPNIGRALAGETGTRIVPD